MGNSQTKESRSTAPSSRRSQLSSGASDSSSRPYHGSRSARGSRPDLSILGIGSHDREVVTLENRRETKQEREARRLEKERVARLKERERSMKEEHVDGGYLVTQGVYVGIEDYNKAVVRQLMIERRLAPFWRGLDDFSESWAEHQIMAAARGMPIPLPDEIPPELEYKLSKITDKTSADTTNIQHLTVPITARSQSCNSDASQSSNPPQSLPSASPIASGTSTSPLFRTRAKTLAALTTSKQNSQTDPTTRELQLPKDPFVNGQPIEVNLYKDASECPICFLYYPPYLNHTRCCDQPICSECFVQIKRPDPHPPEHGEPNANAPSAEGEQAESTESQLVSEPSACPFCVQPEFGVTYAPPSFRRGLTYAPDPTARLSPNFTSPVSSTSSLSSANAAVPGRRRATSLSATDPTVVTTDRIRPDWATKLSNARAHAARRSAAATALHTAAYLINPSASGSDSRGFGIGRRGMRRATGGEGYGGRTASPALNALAFLTERTGADRIPRAIGHDTDSASAEEGVGNMAGRSSSRRNRIDDLEEMMMMEAIRLSLASEDERLKREEKEARKEAKKREKEKEKEVKKADKVARKTGLYGNNASASALDILAESNLARETSGSSSVIGEDVIGEDIAASSKGKGVDRALPSTAEETNRPPLLDPAAPAGQSADPSELSRQSNLRQVSSASSSLSSVMETTPEDGAIGAAAGDGNTGSSEPMYNFRSLAAVIGDEEKVDDSTEHVEDTSKKPQTERSSSSATPSIHQPFSDVNPESTHIIESRVECRDHSGILPKELETRSVEITNSSTHPEATL
ncbi:Protein sip5 [Penicillium digitatum]|uniref:Protein SIP5 n=3 Tax=Penicillium digitatum TaxID=36651 RepID=K9FQB3_PEND2|nr:Protein sip5 [Penicillium digitatum Pd1]EKV11168.1 Protein sip5 [Penicillium digitatum Pd1]EKV11870.1 Protein sip5 [Penicillium digitatum PHI26]QQK43872.1 Protein sip5 [Penicillium digitatum]